MGVIKVTESIIKDSITDNPNMACPPILNTTVKSGFYNRIVACSFNSNCTAKTDFVNSIDVANPLISAYNTSNGLGYIYGSSGSLYLTVFGSLYTDIKNFDLYLSMAYAVENGTYHNILSDTQNNSFTQIFRMKSFSSFWNIFNARYKSTKLDFVFKILGSATFARYDDLCIYQVCKDGFSFNNNSDQCEATSNELETTSTQESITKVNFLITTQYPIATTPAINILTQSLITATQCPNITTSSSEITLPSIAITIESTATNQSINSTNKTLFTPTHFLTTETQDATGESTVIETIYPLFATTELATPTIIVSTITLLFPETTQLLTKTALFATTINYTINTPIINSTTQQQVLTTTIQSLATTTQIQYSIATLESLTFHSSIATMEFLRYHSLTGIIQNTITTNQFTTQSSSKSLNVTSTSFEIVLPTFLTNKPIKTLYIILMKLKYGLLPERNPDSYSWAEISNHTDGLYLVGALDGNKEITTFTVGVGSNRKRRDTMLVPSNPPLESGMAYSTFVKGVTFDNIIMTTSYSEIIMTDIMTTKSEISVNQSLCEINPYSSGEFLSTTEQNFNGTQTATQAPAATPPTIMNTGTLEYCKTESIGEDSYTGVYIFTKTLINSVLSLACKYNKSLTIQRICSSLAVWEPVDLSVCPPKSETTKQLTNLTKINVTPLNVVDIAASLNQVVQGGSLTTYYDINLISNVIQNIINVSLASPVITDHILLTIDTLLTLNKSLITMANAHFNSSANLLSQLDNLGNQQRANFSISKKNIAFASYSIGFNQNPIFIYSIEQENASVDISSEDPRNSSQTFKAYIILPSDLFIGRNVSQIYSFLFLEKLFFRQNSDIDSVVLSVTIKGEIVNNSNISMMFLGDSNGTVKRTCQFYNTSEQFWSPKGCNTTSNSQITKCQCSHLTNFALILDTDQSGYNPLTLQIVSWIGCGISIAGLFITIFSYTIFHKLRATLASQILLNLCVSLMSTLIIFLALVKNTQPRVLCQVVASLLQFFLLSTFFWMVIEGVNLYQLFVKVFRGAHQSRIFMLKSYAYAWGTPLLFTFITAAIKPDNLGPATKFDPKICVLRGYSFYLGLLLPVCVVMAGNIGILILVLRGVDAKSKVANRIEIKKKVRIALGCSLLLGSTWVFSVLAVGDLRDIFQWLFCIFNSLQGFFIFMFYVVQNNEVKNQWRLLLGKKVDSKLKIHANRYESS